MKSIITRQVVILFLAVIITGVYATAKAELKEVSGKMSVTYVKKEVFPVPDEAGHVFYSSLSQGTNSSSNYLDGAEFSNIASSDLVKGSGPHHGYSITTGKEGTEIIKKWNGIVKTVLSPEGKPITTFSGEWKYVKCTGKYEGCAGQGVYNGYFTSKDSYAFDYKGILIY